MSGIRLRADVAPLILAVFAAFAVAGCRTVPVDEHQAVVEQLEVTSSQLALTEQRLARREERIKALNTDVATLEDDLELALRQLGQLREDRLDMQETISGLETELARLQNAMRRADEAPATPERAAGNEPQDALAAALAGTGGFQRVRRIGFQNDPRATARFAGATPGIAVDTEHDAPILYDSRLDYENTLAYLTIVDPEGRHPRLRLTTQYTTSVQPAYVRTAFMTVEGGDPVDPVDPIVLSGEPIRQTDGTLLREALTTNADRTLVDRLAAMISSGRLRVTFVGANGQHTHRPSVAERAALSNILFAFIDLGGVR